MRFIGIDYGTAQIGIAVSDESGTIAFPHATIANDARAQEAIVKLVADVHAGMIVVGDTLTLEGRANDVTPEAMAFIDSLREAVSVPVVRASEAWSTVEAARFAPKGKSHDDSAAAAVILQRYLEMKGGTAPSD